MHVASFKIDIGPLESNHFSRSHAGLKRRETQDRIKRMIRPVLLAVVAPQPLFYLRTSCSLIGALTESPAHGFFASSWLSTAI